jgi:cytochrome c oxidase assembly protein subunit 15
MHMPEKTPLERIPRIVGYWLLLGVFLVFMQVVIGGVTRLTNSGLSMTEWKPLSVLPPLNEADWQSEFEAYRTIAAKQFNSLHAEMTLSEFKYIYFWEYFHRLWARMMGFAFLFPFLYFLWKGWLPPRLLKRLGVVIGIAAVAAVAGWYMVASGLNNDKRTWVSAYRLMLHLGIATALFGYLLWTAYMVLKPSATDNGFPALRRFGWALTGLLLVQIVLGGLMAGTRAGLLHPYWPVFDHWGAFVPHLLDQNQMNAGSLIDYEPNSLLKAWVQILHRTAAVLLVAVALWFSAFSGRFAVSGSFRVGRAIFQMLLAVQFALGVFTVINCRGQVPAGLGSMHQACAFLLLGSALYLNYSMGRGGSVLLEKSGRRDFSA